MRTYTIPVLKIHEYSMTYTRTHVLFTRAEPLRKCIWSGVDTALCAQEAPHFTFPMVMYSKMYAPTNTRNCDLRTHIRETPGARVHAYGMH